MGSRCRSGPPASGVRAARGGFPGGGAGGPQLPKGVTRAQYEAALKKCGGSSFARCGARLQSPAFKAALAKFASCMTENGVNVPAPNTSGKGPIFDTKGIDTASAQFRTAESSAAVLCAGRFGAGRARVDRSTGRGRPRAQRPAAPPPAEALGPTGPEGVTVTPGRGSRGRGLGTS